MHNFFRLRLALAAIISPAIPILALSISYWLKTGSTTWFYIYFLFGYVFFFLVGFPLLGFLIKNRSWKSCALAGGFTAISPIIFINLITLFTSFHSFDLVFFISLILLFLFGGLGGVVFWFIAFWGRSTAVKV